MSKYKEMFISESREHLDGMDVGLIALEKAPKDVGIMQEIMRHSHTLKGIAAEMGYGRLSNLTHSFEGMVENKKNNIAQGGLDLLFGALDEIRNLIDEAETHDAKLAAHPFVDTVGEMEQDDSQKGQSVVKKPEAFRTISEVRVRVGKLDSVLNLASELMVNKLQLHTALDTSGMKRKKHSVLDQAVETHEQLISQLQYEVMQLRLTPIQQIFNRFPRMIRDLAKRQNKAIDLTITGGDIELDRTILDDLAEPLVHLLRNAADHGITDSGTLSLNAVRDKNFVHVEVTDSGNGVRWKQVAEKVGVPFDMTPEGKNVLKEALFKGVSTATTVTDISGRGVGLSVVREKIEQMGGMIDVESPVGDTKKGTRFRLRLPMSLAIMKAIVVTVHDTRFVVPVTSVDRLMRITQDDIVTQADQDIIVVNEEEIPLLYLDQILNVATEEKADPHDHMILLGEVKGARRAFVVSDIDEQYDVVVKPLSKEVRENGFFSAVTILGDGQPVPILDLEALI